MKKNLSLFLMFAMSMTMWADKTLYLVPNSDWKTDQAKFAVYYYVDDTNNGWSEFMTLAEGETDVYTTTIPDGYPKVIFCRMNPAIQTRSWDSKWNQTGDLTLPTDGKNCFTLAAGVWDNATQTWSTYSPSSSEEPAVVPVTRYYLAGNGEAGKAWCCGQNWSANGCPLDSATRSITYANLPAGTYEFKITDGTWDHNWGYSAVTAACSTPGYINNNGNVCFTTSDAGAVTIQFDGTNICLTAENLVERYASSAPAQAPDVMLQAFYWDSYPNGSGTAYGNTGWQTLLVDSAELGTYFDLVWLPPVANGDGTGYIPRQYSNLNSAWGSESDLRLLISALHRRDSRVVADIVINHCGNHYNSCDFWPLDFGTYGTFQPDNTWVTTNDEGNCGGGSHADVGYEGEQNYSSARDWDHLNPNVQAMCRAYLQWMKAQGFDGWRYDYGKGFTHDHINDYNTAAGAYFSVVEYWDGNRDNLQARLNDANWNTMVFDFSNKYNALNDGIAAFNYSKCQGAGLPGAGKSRYAVTFVDNHDTFTRDDGEFGGQNNSMTPNMRDRLLQANAYILSMPGIPCVFYPHWYTHKEAIKKMIEARHMTGVHSESAVTDEQVEQGGYQATITGKNGYIVLQLGNKAGNTISGFTKYAYGNGYAIWIHTNTPIAPETNEFYVTGDSALVVDAGLTADKQWNADAIHHEGDTLTLTLKAGVNYSLKVTIDGTWATAKGYDILTTKAEGLSTDNDNNINFKLAEAGPVQVIYTPSLFKLVGNFYVEPIVPIVVKDLRLVPGVWTDDNAVLGAWAWGENADGAWSAFAGEGDTLTAKINQKADSVIFVRFANGQTLDWNSTEWNRTANLKIDSCGLFFVNDWDNYSWCEAPEPAPVDDAKYYITGDSALVDSLAWNPKAIKAVSDTTVLNLAAGSYKLKVTVDGTWATAKGYDNLTTKAEGLSADNDNNIVFTLAEAGAVTVVYNDSVFVLVGTFYVEPIVPIVVKDLRLVPGVWTDDNAVLGAWAWGENADGAWSAFAGEGDTLTAKINQKADSVIFVRFANGQTLDWNSTIWNRTANLGIDSCGLFIVNDWDNYSWCEAPEPAPVDDAKYYITGDTALVGASLAWNTKAIKAVNDTTVLNLAAGDYKLKVTVDGTWDTAKGYSDLTTQEQGLSVGDNNNILFTLAAAGDVIVIYIAATAETDEIFRLIGNFATDQPTDLDLIPAGQTLYKVIENGTLYIYREGTKYNAAGQVVR